MLEEKSSEEKLEAPSEEGGRQVFTQVLMVNTENVTNEPFESTNEVKVRCHIFIFKRKT